MKLSIFLPFIILSFNFTIAQKESMNTLEVLYRYTIRGDTVTKDITYQNDYILNIIIEENVSFFDEIKSLKPGDEGLKETKNKIIWKPKGKNLSLVYKNYKNNEIYLKQHIDFRFFVVKDSLKIFNWEIKNETKEILGYSCVLAKMNFRGRIYEAWFSMDLPIGGPWKYDGLPGLILSIYTLDNFLSYEAFQIKTEKKEIELTNVKNPFIKDKYLTWTDFKSLYKKKAIESSKYQPESRMKIVTPRMLIERYIEEDDPDYTADKINLQVLKKNKD